MKVSELSTFNTIEAKGGKSRK